jgi:hypothetical protein
MSVVKVRITADIEVECELARQYLQEATKGTLKFQKPREGSNPKYEGQQKWFAYGEMVMTDVPPMPSPPKRGDGGGRRGSNSR